MLTHKITELKNKIRLMAKLVEQMAVYSFSGIEQGVNRYREVMELEQQVNQLELEIEDECIILIALHQPEAKDLRVILMIYKINNDLERLGDQAFNIAESAAKMAGNPLVKLLPDLISMQEIALRMLHQSINAYLREDVDQARLVCRQDEVVDSYNRNIYNQLVQLMKEQPERIEPCLHLLRIAKNLERIADLSTNIGENTVYLVQGRIIRHHLDDEQTD